MVLTSPDADPVLDDRPLPDFVLERATERGDRPAVVDGTTGEVTTYAGLAAAVERAARGWVARGLRPGEVVALHSPNGPAYPVVLYGVLRAGGVVTTVNPAYTVREVAAQLRDSAARFVVTVADLRDRVATAAEGSAVEEVFVVGDPPAGEGELPTVAADDVAVLPYSSGTTGLPKGVLLTHRTLVANLCQLAPVVPVGADDVAVAVLPLFHIYGLTIVLNHTLRCGGTVVTLPRFELAGFLSVLAKHRVTRAYIVPPIALAMAKSPLVDGHDLTALRAVFTGAAPLGAEAARACEERLGAPVVQGYGLTEASPVTHVNPEGAGRRLDTVGPLIPGTRARLVDPGTGADAEEGELWIAGPQVMRGYLGDPAASAATVDADGWLHTGDIARADPDGHFRVVDRLKELIKVKGFQVAPAELEALLVAHPGVAQAAVVPAPDAEAGEVPWAFVVPATGARPTPAELVAHVAGQVATYKRLAGVSVVDAIPTSPSGKILRRLLTDRVPAR